MSDPGTRELILRCLDGVASEVDAAELSRLVASDPGVARQLAQAARFESNLEVVTRAQPGAVTSSQPHEVSRLRPRRTFFAAGATIAAAALAAAWLLAVRHPADRVVASSGASTASPPANAAPTVDSRHRLRFPDGSTADLRDDASRLETRVSTPTAIDLVLAEGSARFEVAHRPGRRFRVWVADTYVEVIGTIFTVERLPTGARVSVERGVVKVVSGQNEMRLSAGAAEVVPLEQSAGHVTAEVRDWAPERVREQSPQRAQREAGDSGRSARPKDEPGALLRASEDARRGGHPEEALTLLQELLDRHPRDPRAAYAAFIMGRVLLEELNRPREAASAFARVEALDPKTPLVQDALAREVESWARANDGERARERARAYIGRYPNGRRVSEVRRYSQME